jgi:MFS family permease
MLAKRTKILLISDYFMVFGSGMFGPLFAIFTEKVGGDILDISWVWATYLIITGIIIMIVGKISDKWLGKEKLVVIGFLLSAIFTLGYLLVSTPLHLFLVQIGLAFGTALSFPTWDALYAKYEDKKHDGFNWGLVDGGEQIVPGIAMLVGGFIVVYFGFPTLFILMAIVQFIGAISQARILEKKNL